MQVDKICYPPLNINIYLYVIFFIAGFGLVKLELLLLLMYISVWCIFIGSIKAQKSFLILLVLYILFIMTTFIMGGEMMTNPNPFKTMVAILIQFVFLGYFLHIQKYENKIKLLGTYLLGVFLYNFIIVIYSFTLDPVLYGYGRLFNPMSSKEENSPGSAELILLSFSYFYFFCVSNNVDFKIKVLSIFVVISSICSIIFLSSRISFLLMLGVIVYYYLINIKRKNIYSTIFFIILFFIVVTALLVTSESLHNSLIFLLNRFMNQGLDSTRFLHYKHGLDLIWQYPLGGFEVDRSIENTKWFHNIFLDTARVAGWIPNIFLIGAIVYPLTLIKYKNKQKEICLPIVMFIIVMLLMQFGVILEGNSRYIVISFFVSCILLNSKTSYALKTKEC